MRYLKKSKVAKQSQWASWFFLKSSSYKSHAAKAAGAVNLSAHRSTPRVTTEQLQRRPLQQKWHKYCTSEGESFKPGPWFSSGVSRVALCSVRSVISSSVPVGSCRKLQESSVLQHLRTARQVSSCFVSAAARCRVEMLQGERVFPREEPQVGVYLFV